MTEKTKIFIANVLIIFGIVFLGSLSADAVFGTATELKRNLFVSAVAAALAALAQAKAYLDKETSDNNNPGNGKDETKDPPKDAVKAKEKAPKKKLWKLRYGVLISW